MLQEFNKVTTTSNFIKNLLISTYLPLIRTVRDFDYIIADRLYIYKCEVIKCTKSGYIVTGYQYYNFKGERAEYRVQAEYYFGERNDKLCTNYISNSEGYDYLTHERLGKYLRSLRDMYDLNLMPLYNCFSNEIFQTHHISNDKVEKSNLEYNTKVYKIPIRFNTDYTICMDNLGITTFAPAFIKNNNLMKVNNTRFGNNIDITNKYAKLHRTGVITNKANLRFKDPILIRFNNIPETKKVTYFEKSLRKIDVLHNEIYYSMVTSSDLERIKYYIRNEGGFDRVDITQEEFQADPTKYWCTDDGNGILRQCTYDENFDPSKYYYVVNDKYQFTFLPTNLTPETAVDRILYIGVEPCTGRQDSTYLKDKEYIWLEGDTLFTDIRESDYPSLSLNDTTLEVDVRGARVFDGSNFEAVTLWRRCQRYSKFDPEQTYYIRKDNLFEEWVYYFDEETFNQNKTFYYIKDGEKYIRCTRDSIFDPNIEYYVLYDGEYITTKEYEFITNTTDFYIGLGFSKPATEYYKLVDGKYVPLYYGEEFDINTSYAVKIDRELYTWKVINDQGKLVDSTDIYIKEGVDYYARYDLETEKEYVYDITEENCSLYDFFEDNLYLLIQVPKSFNSNILVLEGDYTNTNSKKIIDDSQVDMLPRPMVDYLYTSNLHLMEMPTKKVIPFSNSLLEFLLWNAINNLDSINNNMDRLVIAIENVLHYNPFSVNYANYWYPNYRKVVYDIGKTIHNIPIRDNIGYVTKDIEKVLYTAPVFNAM